MKLPIKERMCDNLNWYSYFTAFDKIQFMHYAAHVLRVKDDVCIDLLIRASIEHERHRKLV